MDHIKEGGDGGRELTPPPQKKSDSTSFTPIKHMNKYIYT